MIDINCDMGESYGRFTIGNDNEILDYVHSCNIACGFHAGDPSTIIRIIETAIKKGKNVGAHPGYPDLAGFGRRSMTMNDQEFRACIFYQVAVIKSIAEIKGGKLHHVKPHGAMYHDLYKNREKAIIFCEVIQEVQPDLKIYTNPGSILGEVAASKNIEVWVEAFADRRYNSDLSLVTRNKNGAVIENVQEAREQALDIVKNHKVTTMSGEEFPIQADTICVHGDTSSSLDIAKAIHKAFKM